MNSDSEDDRWAADGFPNRTQVAYHEAGHAVAFLMTGMVDVHVEIPDDDWEGEAKTCCAPPIDDARQRIRRRMAGAVAEIFVLGCMDLLRGVDRDFIEINLWLNHLAESGADPLEVRLSLWSEMERAFGFPDVNTTTHEVARALLEHCYLGDAALRSLAAKAGLRTTLPLSPPTA